MVKQCMKCNKYLAEYKDTCSGCGVACKGNTKKVDFQQLVAKEANKPQVSSMIKIIEMMPKANEDGARADLLNLCFSNVKQADKTIQEQKTNGFAHSSSDRRKTKASKSNNNMKDTPRIKGDNYQYIKSKIDEMNAAGSDIHIVNAGSMNHGKSSLFNSLLDREAYAVGDVRMTKIRQDELFEDGVYFVDTPGLSATAEDDDEAFEAYKSANMVVFTHTPKIGELHEEEIKCINKIASLFPSQDYFWKHFCLVFTFSEGINAEELDKIKNKILNDIEKNCQGKGFPVFEVSNLRYNKGKEMHKEGFIQHSGILELRKYLLDNIKVWREEAKQLKKDKIAALIKLEVEKLEKKKAEAAAKLRKHEQALNSQKKRINTTIDEVLGDLDYVRQNCKDKEDAVISIRCDIRDGVIDVHNEHVNFYGASRCSNDINKILDEINARDIISATDIRR